MDRRQTAACFIKAFWLKLACGGGQSSANGAAVGADTPPVFLRHVSVGPIVESIQREGSLKPSTRASLRVGEKHSRSEQSGRSTAAQQCCCERRRKTATALCPQSQNRPPPNDAPKRTSPAASVRRREPLNKTTTTTTTTHQISGNLLQRCARASETPARLNTHKVAPTLRPDTRFRSVAGSLRGAKGLKARRAR